MTARELRRARRPAFVTVETMSKRKESNFDPDKFLDDEGLRINLLLASLYLTSFEVLKMAIVEQVANFFVSEDAPTPEEIDLLE